MNTEKEKQIVNKLATDAWEEDCKTRVTPNNPYAFVDGFKKGYSQGLKDAEQSKWIPVEERLPDSERYLDGYSKDWIHPDFNPEGICECFHDDLMGWVRCYWCNECDEYHTVTSDNERHEKYSPPTHWRYRASAPDLPEQGKEKE